MSNLYLFIRFLLWRDLGTEDAWHCVLHWLVLAAFCGMSWRARNAPTVEQRTAAGMCLSLILVLLVPWLAYLFLCWWWIGTNLGRW